MGRLDERHRVGSKGWWAWGGSSGCGARRANHATPPPPPLPHPHSPQRTLVTIRTQGGARTGVASSGIDRGAGFCCLSCE